MSIARILIITLLISVSIVALVLFNLESEYSDQDAEDGASPPAQVAPAEKPQAAPSTPAAPDTLANPAEDALTPEDAAAEEQLEKEQIAQALAQLNSTNDEERIEAVEQLGAYPNTETETTLTGLLTSDNNPEIRNAAALSLGSLDQPSEATVQALSQALEDQNEDVRFSALSTLEDYMLGQEDDSPGYRHIRDLLKQRAQAASLSSDLRESINEVLRDQQNIAAPEAEPDN